MAGLWQRMLDSLFTSQEAKRRRRVANRRNLRMESLENRRLMAFNIGGTVYTDANDNGVFDSGETRLSGVNIEVFSAGVNGVFDNGTGDDVSIDTDTSDTNGLYSIPITVAGTYLVKQTAASGSLVQRAAVTAQQVTVTAGQVAGTSLTTVTVLDTFSFPSALDSTAISADFGGTNPDSNSTASTQALGGFRDIFANASAGTLDMTVNTSSNNALNLSPQPGADGVFLLTYDGTDANANNAIGTQLGTGTNNFDLTQGGTASAFRLLIGTENGATNSTVRITVSSAGGTSTVLKTIPDSPTGIADQTLVVDFIELVGTADLTQVGGIQFEFNQDVSVDSQVDTIDTVLNQATINFANLNPMTIGNLVYRDINSNGTFDSGTDAGIGGVDLQLFNDLGVVGTFEPGTDTAVTVGTSTTTSATSGTVGSYSFTGLLPGNYFVVIPAAEFGSGQTLVGHRASTIVGAVDTNNTNKGIQASATALTAAAVVLSAAGEPTTDGDDANTNSTIDFGFTNTVLQLTKTDSPDPVSVGQNLTYTLTATNNGPSTSTNTVISDPLPTGLTFVSATYVVNGGAVQNANNVSGTVSTGTFTLAATQQAVLTIIATVGGTFVNNTQNTGSVVSTEVTTPVTANANTALTPNVDLGIQKTIVGAATTIGLGGALTYRLTLTNINTGGVNPGNVTVTGIEVTDNLPVGFTLGTLPTGVALDTTTTDPNDIIWSVATLQAGTANAVTVDIPITVSSTAVLGLTPNTAIIDVTPTGLVGFNDTNTANNTSTVSITVEPRYDLLITKDDGATAVATGQQYTYTLAVNNNGPSPASNVVVSDTLPAGLEFVSANISGTPFGSANGQVFSGTIATLASGATTNISLIVRVRSNATGSIANTASVTADNPTQETAGRSNTSTDTNTLNRTVTLNVTKDDSTDPVIAGGANFTYTVTAFNSGNADTTNSVFTDVLPTGIEFVSGTFAINESTPRNGNVSFDTNTRTVTANLGTLLPGSSTTNRALITLTVRAAATAAAGQVSNVARLTSADNTTGVTDTETTQINRDFDVTVSKNDNNVDTVASGQSYVYTIVVTNTGSSTATNVTVTDPLPQNLTFVSATSGFTFDTNTRTVSGTIASLATGAPSTITISTTVNNNTPNATVLNNTVTVAATGESNTTNNTATATATVVNTANLTGRVYVDSNNNGVRDTNEAGIAGVTINLNGTPTIGSTVSRTATTDVNGEYTFTAVPIGTYTVTQVQPANFTSRSTNVGTIGNTPSGTAAENQISAINLTGDSIANNFGEIVIFSKRRFLASS